MNSTLDGILTEIEASALDADQSAALACARSKYSVQDYYVCLEFALSALHDRIARRWGSERRCKRGPFREQLSAFRRDVKARIAQESPHG